MIALTVLFAWFSIACMLAAFANFAWVRYITQFRAASFSFSMTAMKEAYWFTLLSIVNAALVAVSLKLYVGN